MTDNMTIVNKLRCALHNMPRYSHRKNKLDELIKIIGSEKYHTDKVLHSTSEVILRWPLVCERLLKGKPIPKELMVG